MALVKGQQYTPAQIYQEDPGYLQKTNPALYSQFVQQVGQPTAGLVNTQTSTAATAANIPGDKARSDVATQTAPAQVTSINSDAVVAQQKANAAKFLADVTNNFGKARKDNGGKVPAPYYNEVKGEAGQFGIDSPSFDNAFRANNVDTNKEIQYNTEQGVTAQENYGQLKRNLETAIDSFTSVPADQRKAVQAGQGKLLDNPYLAMTLAPQAASYENARTSLSAQLSNLAGGGSGSGLRISQAELDRWGNLLPSSKYSDSQNAKNIRILNDELKAKFNTSDGLGSKYFGGSPAQNPAIQKILSPNGVSQQSQGAWQ